ncbi:MAG: VCBS repeat-containing protein [candidate division WOR-3 bacterium]|nr:MAG: VCBS repeat-containing protein [candidate division WOR-3 bacterium]
MKSALVSVVLAMAMPGLCRVIHVPGDYPTIQQGIDAAVSGDIVMVAPGTYPEEIELKSGVVVRGAGEGRSIIDGGGDQGDVVRAVGNAINRDTRIEGFTITGASNSGSMPGGGGVFCNSGAKPDISNCRVEGNDTGIALWNGSTALIHNCVIINNLYNGISTGAGGTAVNNTVHNNRTGFYDYSGYRPVVMNNIITGNSRYGISGPSSGNGPQISYNDVWGNTENYHNCSPGVGDISDDPMYEDTVSANYHLLPGSPCIDTGNPDPQYNDPDGTRNDMGAYGGPEAISFIPTVITMGPGPNEADAAVDTDVSAGFNMAMDTATVNDATFVVRGQFTGDIIGAVMYDTLARMVTLDPDNDFLPGEPVTACLTKEVLSAIGDSLNGWSWQFTAEAGTGSGHFGDTSLFPTGDGPIDIIAADLNQDRNIDLVSIGASPGTVSALLGNGDGSFDTAFVANAGATAIAACHGDFNADSILDLAVACDMSSVIAVLLGNGNGTFRSAVNYSVAAAPRGICCSDLNLDGVLDLTATIPSLDSFAVLLGIGDGTFAGARNFPAGDYPDGIVATDFNNDGRPDIATANYFEDSLSVLLGMGDGTFGAPLRHDAGGECFNLGTSDFDLDGNADLAMVLSDDGSVTVLLGDGQGNFPQRASVDVGETPEDIVCTDFNGDGQPDFAVADDYQYPGNVRVLLGDGRGGFTRAGSFPAGEDPFALAAADFDSDSDIDVATANYNYDYLAVLLNIDALVVTSTDPAQHETSAPDSTDVSAVFSAAINQSTLDSASYRVHCAWTGFHPGVISYDPGTMTATLDPATDFVSGEPVSAVLGSDIATGAGVELGGYCWSFTARVPVVTSGEFNDEVSYPTGRQPRGIWSADFDSDGDIDICLTSNTSTSTGAITLLRNNGNGTFAAPEYTSCNSDPIALFGADLDADTDFDLAVFHNQPGTSHLEIMKNDGSGNFTLAHDYTPATLGQHLAGGDFDCDGDIDLVLSDGWGSQDNVRVMRNTGNGTFTGPASYSAGSHARGAAVADVDNDGYLDILVANSGNQNLSVLYNDGTGSFPVLANFSTGTGPHRIHTADFDSDGWVDIATTHYSNAEIRVLLNNGDGTFGSPEPYAALVNTRTIDAGDFDGDRDIDLAMGSSNADTAAVLLNNGDGTFDNLMLYKLGQNPWGVDVAEYDNDRALDLAFACYSSNSVSVLLGLNTGIAGKILRQSQSLALEVSPSVLRGIARISYQAPAPGPASLQILDIAGRIVRELETVRGRPGAAVWDCRDAAGRAAAPGVYFIRLSTAEAELQRKAVLTR